MNNKFLSFKNAVIRSSVVLVASCASLLLMSTIMLAITNTENTLVAKIGDASVTARVKSNLLWSAYNDNASTDVATLMGKVTLTGSTDTADFRDLAGWIATSTGGVVAVDNQLIVRPPVAIVQL